MRVMLISPPVSPEEEDYHFLQGGWRKRSLLPRAKPVVGIMPSFSLLYLAEPLRRHGHEVAYREGFGATLEGLVSAASAWNAEVVALTSMTFRWSRVVELAAGMRRAMPSVRIVVGGIHVTDSGARAVLDECPAADAVFAGEGEQSFPLLVDHFADGTAPHGVPGVLARWGDELVENAPAPDIMDLDALPFPDRSLIDVASYVPSPLHHRALPNTSLFGARGCPYRCTFCHTSPRIRVRSAASMADEIEECVKRWDVEDISIWDDVFSLRAKRVYEFCEELERRKLRVHWSVNARVEHVTEDMLRAMKSAGCWSVLYGIESVNEESLAQLGKKTQPEEVEAAVRAARRAGVQSLGTFILGVPGEGFEGGLRTIDHAVRLGLDYAFFGYLTPFPGTTIRKRIDAGELEGHWVSENRYDIKNVTWVPAGTTEEELEDLARIALKRFYFRPAYLLAAFRRLQSLHELLTHVNAFFHFLAAATARPRGSAAHSRRALPAPRPTQERGLA